MNEKLIPSLVLSIAGTMLIGVFATAVVAQEEGLRAKPPTFIERFDQNGDRLVTIDEFTGPEERFDRLDRNGDEAIDADEAPQGPPHGPPPDPEEVVTRFDEDGDGRLSESEFPGPDHHFDHLDTDGDGVVTTGEMRAGMPGPRPGRPFERE